MEAFDLENLLRQIKTSCGSTSSNGVNLKLQIELKTSDFLFRFKE